jgi:hypothetical protein
MARAQSHLNTVEGELGVAIEETLFATNVEAEAISALECARLVADGTDKRATTKTVQTQELIQEVRTPGKPFKYLGLFGL